jgi:hypothetical protein
MILAGVINSSLGNEFGYAVCVITILNAVFNVSVMAAYPKWTAKVVAALQ